MMILHLGALVGTNSEFPTCLPYAPSNVEPVPTEVGVEQPLQVGS